MTRNCEFCGKPFEAKRPTAKYCSGSCRAKKSKGTPPPPPPMPASVAGRPVSGLLDAVTSELEKADTLNSIAGQHALELAKRIVNAPGMNTGVAALSKQLQVVLGDALGSTVKKASPLDELKARRDAKRTG